MTTTDRISLPEHFGTAAWVAGTWSIDPAHTTVGFAVRHLMSKVRGTFGELSGQIVTGLEPSACSVTAEVAVSSVNTGNEMRDNHLRSADFFDAERMPVMKFASTELRADGDAWVLAGDLTIRDVTRQVEWEVEFLGIDPSGLQGEKRIGFTAQATISRRDFGVTFGLAADGTKIVVGDKIDLTLDVEAFSAA